MDAQLADLAVYNAAFVALVEIDRVIGFTENDGLLEKKNVVIFTASSINEQEADALVDEGAKGILRKPFPVEDLEAIMDRFQRN
jgi:CheY-like chemotaxis protein